VITTDEIETRVFQMIREQLGQPEFEVHRELNFGLLGFDSMDELELLIEYEDEFDLEIPESVSVKWRTPGDVIDWLEKELSK